MKQLFTFFIITTLCICKTNYSIAQVNVSDSLALVDLYNSTDGAHWTDHTNWLTGPVNTWFGVYVSGGRVLQIDLYSNNMKGTLPSSIGNLSAMYFFRMSNNKLTGIIPPSIGNLTNLSGFTLEDNQLTGFLPSSLGNLTKIELITVFNNQLTGTLKVLENFTNPFDLELNNNQFTGPLPNLQNIDKMYLLNLDNNKLNGDIPESYSHFTGDQLTLNNNQLSGTIPASFSNLDLYAIFDIQVNHFNFDSLEYIISNSLHYYFLYAPQQNIPITYTPQGAYGKLSVHAGGTLGNNTYQWYRNNSLYKTIVGDSAFIVDSPGVYFVKVNNAVVTALQLMSDSITIAAACAASPSGSATKSIQQTSARLAWNASQGAIKYQVKYAVAGSSSFTTINTTNTAFKLNGLTPNTKYGWKVRAKCPLQFSAFSALNSFTTLPAFAGISQSEDEVDKENNLTLYPNPATNNVNVMFIVSKQSSYAITIYDLQGKMLLNKTGIANPGNNNFILDIHALSVGTYLVKIQYDVDKTIMKKLVKE